MAELRRALASLPLSNARTYIQSGNVVFESGVNSASTLAKKMGTRVEQQFGFRPSILVLSIKELRAAIRANPFPNATLSPRSLHFLFLDSPPAQPDTLAIRKAKSPTEAFKLTDRVFYLHAPDGIARSKLAANAERWLGVTATGRNYRTVIKLAEMCQPPIDD